MATPEAPLVGAAEVAAWVSAIPQPIAVTGGTGFLGSHLIDTLCAAGVRPRVLVRRPSAPRWIAGREVEWVTGSLEASDALVEMVQGAGTVLHLAGVVRAGSAAGFDRGNRAGTELLAAAVRRAAPAARVVHVSSLAAAGPSPDPAGIEPDAEPRPISAYGRSKLAAERALDALPEERRMVLRPPAIYGPRDTDVLQFFRMVERGLVALPAGERWVTMAWVGDVVRAVLAAAAGGPWGRTLHLGEPRPYRFEELVALLAASGGRRVRVVRVPALVLGAAGAAGSLLQGIGLGRVPLTRDKARELLARHWTARSESSLAALGLPPSTPFATGATATWAWYRAVGWLG